MHPGPFNPTATFDAVLVAVVMSLHAGVAHADEPSLPPPPPSTTQTPVAPRTAEQPLATQLDGTNDQGVGDSRFSAYLELGGVGVVGSVNVDLVLGDAIAFRIGYSIAPLVGVDIAILPLTISYLGQRSSVHRYELGVGVLVVTEGPDTFPIGTALVGYRYQPRHGFLFRIGACGFWDPDKGVMPFPLPYLSVGSTF